MAPTPPPGFEPVTSSAFLDLIGPFYVDPSAPYPRFGTYVGAQHANTFGGAHGGFLTALVDVAAGRGIRSALADGRAFRTVSMTVDFTAPAAPDDWVEFRITLDRVGRRTAFVTCRVVTGDTLVARASVILSASSAAPDGTPSPQ